MRMGVKFFAMAMIVPALLTGGAVAQSSGQAVNQNAGDSSNTAQAGKDTAVTDAGGVATGSVARPESMSEGTLAESASTTALATSTYHQPTGFLPGMKP